MRAPFLLVLIAACGGSAPARPNVLVVTIDTLRADAVGGEKKTPAIGAFLAAGAHFTPARTVAPLTLPAHVSLFTGLFPARHGIHDNVIEPLGPRGARPFSLLAEEFKDRGYATAAFVARAVLAAPTGIASGFDVYECPERDEGIGYVKAEERIEAALKWMGGASGDRPWFVWVHLFDPHAPYFPFPGDAERPPTYEGDPTEVLYAGEVRRADAAFGKLVAAAGKDTIVVLASDHGEGLMEHGEPTHGPLCYGSTIDMVLALRAPGVGAGAKGLRSIADVAPTLRRLCQLTSQAADGTDLFGPPHETLVAESLFTWRIHGWAQCFAVTDGSYSLIESGARQELFDRRADPGERRPLALSDPAYEKLDRALDAFRKVAPVAGEGELLISVPPYGELRRRGRGYLPRYENVLLLDPCDHLTTWVAIETVPNVIAMCRARDDPAPLETALRLLDEVESRAPKSPRVEHYRADVYVALAELTQTPSRCREAAWAELAAIEKGYVQPQTILPAIDYCVRGSDPEALHALMGLLKRDGRKLRGPPARALADAAKRLNVEGVEAFLAPD